MFNFEEASQKGKEVMEGVLKSYADVTKGFQVIAEEAAEFSKKSFEEGVAHIEAITSVKSPEAAFELQTSFLRASYERTVSEMSRIGELYVDLAKTAYKPFEAPVAKAAAPAAKPAKAAAPAAAPADAASAA